MEAHHGAVRIGLNDDVAEAVGVVIFVAGAQQQFLGVALDGAARDVEVEGAHGVRRLREGQVVGAQIALAESNFNFLIGEATQFDLGNEFVEAQFLFHLAPVLFERPQIDVAANAETDGEAEIFEFVNRWRFHAHGKGRNAVHGVLHVLHDHVGIVAAQHLHGDRTGVLAAGRGVALHTGQPLQVFLDFIDNALFDLFGRGTGINGLNTDDATFDLREEGRFHIEHPEHAEQQQADHEQVGGNLVADEIVDDVAHGAGFLRWKWNGKGTRGGAGGFNG